MNLAWGAKVSADFCQRVMAIAQDTFHYLDAASDLMSCMAFESAGTFSPSIRNAAGSGAVGLIQFMPSTAMGLGTSTYLLSLMTAEDQLRFVQAYFRPYAPRIHSLSDMYMAILMPHYVGLPDDAVLFQGTSMAYNQNQGLDTNKDDQVTKGEVCARLYAKRAEGLLPPEFPNNKLGEVMAPNEGSGRHRVVRDEDRFRRLNDRITALEGTHKQLMEIIQLSNNAALGLRVAAQLGRIIRWFLVVGAAATAIWAAFLKK